jgi:hypothetical protein
VTDFSFEHENPEIDTEMKLIKERIVEEPEVEIVTYYHNKNHQKIRQLLHCYHVPEDDCCPLVRYYGRKRILSVAPLLSPE